MTLKAKNFPLAVAAQGPVTWARMA